MIFSKSHFDTTNLAVVSSQRTLTYLELYRLANQVGNRLQQLGVSPNTLVAVVMEKGWEQVVAVLGILISGAAYLPIDPEIPIQRRRYLLEQGDIQFVLTQSKLNENMEWPENIQRVCVDTEDLAEGGFHSHDLIQNPEDLAYVIYTSGSTGLPKGVMIDHRAAMNTITDINQRFGIGSQDRVLALSALNFDLSVYDIFGILAAGGTLIIPDAAAAKDPSHWIELMLQHQVTIWNSVPALMLMLVEYVGRHPEKLPTSLRLVLLSGDWIPLSLPAQIKALGKNVQIVSLGGATEASIWSIFYPIETIDPGWKSIPYGKPLTNQNVYVLNQLLEPCPEMVIGELYIGGIGLAKGYWRDEEKTLKHFIIHPQTHERLYKTGDLGRYLPDGNIEFLGREDFQVKINGYRIELGEIESVLTQHPNVKQTLVIAPKDQAGNKSLVAYVIPKLSDYSTGSEIQAEQISQWQQVYNNTYSQPAPNLDPKLNTIGWNDSYTGLPIPKEEMCEWVDSAVERILSLKPDRVLEIGCGIGLLLFRIAPQCSYYCATDISDQALSYLEEQIRQLKHPLPQVRLLQRAANEFEGLEEKTFDTVILNSVAQYFPCIDYLVNVLEEAVKVLSPDGCIFVGDVRSLPLLPAFHASVQFNQAPDSLSTKELLQRIQNKISHEEELVIDPAFFIALKQHLPEISQVQIQIKRGQYNNELTRFRYDVIFHLGAKTFAPVEPLWLNWQQHNLTIPAVRKILVEKHPEVLSIKQVPNLRLLAEVKLLELLAKDEGFATVGDLRKALRDNFPEQGIDPEEWWALNQELPYNITISWSDGDTKGCYDVIFEASRSQEKRPQFDTTGRIKPWGAYANNPLETKLKHHLGSQLDSFLKQILPNYMVPSAFVFLDAFPLTPNGKVDSRNLPPPSIPRLKQNESFVAPRTPIQEVLAKLWAEILEVEVGIYDNFFELGGHSLLAIQLLSQVHKTFSVELPLSILAEKPTVATMAERIERIHQATQYAATSTIALVGEREEGEI